MCECVGMSLRTPTGIRRVLSVIQAQMSRRLHHTDRTYPHPLPQPTPYPLPLTPSLPLPFSEPSSPLHIHSVTTPSRTHSLT